MQGEVVTIEVGGVPYALSKSEIEKYPGSFVDCITKKEWSRGNQKITIDRDGKLFKYVYAFLVSNSLPRGKDGELLLDLDTLEALKVEADFYGLEELARECHMPLKTTAFANVASYMTMRKYIDHLKGDKANGFEVEHRTNTFSTELIDALSEVWAPFCLTGNLEKCVRGNAWSRPYQLFRSSTLNDLNVSELLEHAKQSAFGHGSETVSDTSVRNSYEIDASLLNSEAIRYLQGFLYLGNFMPNRKVELHPYKLVIYQAGGHFDGHRDTVRGEGHIGTLVVILNSEYTGGELEVTHGGRTEVVTGPYHWVAMYGDCLHKINPVTSGTRVSLIYDIYASQISPAPAVMSAQQRMLTGTFNTSMRAVDANQNDGVSQASSSEHSSAVYSTQEEQEEEPVAEYGDINFVDDISFVTDADSEFLYQPLCGLDPKSDTRARGADAALQLQILQAIDKELQEYDIIVISLQHLYPECQTHPSFLKGGDRILYEVLTNTGSGNISGSGSNHSFNVEVVAATISHTKDPAFSSENTVLGRLFSPSIVHQALNPDADQSSAAIADHTFTSTDGQAKGEPPFKRARHLRTKLVLPNAMNSTNLLDYSPYEAYTGNESQAEEYVYIVAGLQVRRTLY